MVVPLTEREAAEKALKDVGATPSTWRTNTWNVGKSVEITLEGGTWLARVYLSDAPPDDPEVVDQWRARGYSVESLLRFIALLSPTLTEEERKALDVCATALELLASPGVQMALRHARKHRETVGLDADDYFNVTEAYVEWDHTHAAALRAVLSRYGGDTV